MELKESFLFVVISLVGIALCSGDRVNDRMDLLMKGYNELTPQVERSTGTDYFGVELVCDHEPQTVHELRPRDIDVIGALGDSITAGTGAGADNLVQMPPSYRGLSWTIGGDFNLSASITLPNILRKFNPNIKGYALGTGPRGDPGLNAAVPGARARNIPDQARDLIGRIRDDPTMDFAKDWKLVSVFIGGNDLCALTAESSRPENYIAKLAEGLDILHAELPRTLVNVVEIMQIYLLPQVPDGFGANPLCGAVQATECGYVATADEERLEYINEQNLIYQELTQELVASGKYDTRDDFTVVNQPFFRHTVLPLTEDGEVDSTYFAPDCFHFSHKGHALGAANLWNNMLEPVGQKSTVWNISDLKCPTEDQPYIFTRLNSGLPGSGDGDDVMTTSYEVTTAPMTSCDPQTTECTQETPDWLIAVLAVLGAALLIEAIFLVVVLSRKQQSFKPQFQPNY